MKWPHRVTSSSSSYSLLVGHELPSFHCTGRGRQRRAGLVQDRQGADDRMAELQPLVDLAGARPGQRARAERRVGGLSFLPCGNAGHGREKPVPSRSSLHFKPCQVLDDGRAFDYCAPAGTPRPTMTGMKPMTKHACGAGKATNLSVRC